MTGDYLASITVREGDEEVVVPGGPHAIEQAQAIFAARRRWREEDAALKARLADHYGHRFDLATMRCLACGITELDYHHFRDEDKPSCPTEPRAT